MSIEISGKSQRTRPLRIKKQVLIFMYIYCITYRLNINMIEVNAYIHQSLWKPLSSSYNVNSPSPQRSVWSSSQDPFNGAAIDVAVVRGMSLCVFHLCIPLLMYSTRIMFHPTVWPLCVYSAYVLYSLVLVYQCFVICGCHYCLSSMSFYFPSFMTGRRPFFFTKLNKG